MPGAAATDSGLFLTQHSRELETGGSSRNPGNEGRRRGALSRKRKHLSLWALASRKIIRIYRIKYEPMWGLQRCIHPFLDGAQDT